MSKLYALGAEVEVENDEDACTETFIDEADLRKPAASINVTELEAQFLTHCMEHGWIVKERVDGRDCYYATEGGKRELCRFGLISQE